MKRVLLSILCFALAVFLFTGPAGAADPDLYFSGKAGLTMPADSSVHFDAGLDAEFEYDPGFSFAAAIGGQISDSMRIEPEISYQKNDLDKASSGGGSVSVNGDASALAFMTNLYYDFLHQARATPYIGGGIGFAKVEVSDITSPAAPGYYIEGDKDSVFCYQASAGVAWAVGSSMVMDLSYRYFATEDPDFEISETEFASHNFYVGIRVSF